MQSWHKMYHMNITDESKFGLIFFLFISKPFFYVLC